MLSRRLLLVLSAVALPVATLWSRLGLSQAAAQNAQTARIPNLKTQLETGLKARQPQDFRFIALVVYYVEQDKLPLKLVQQAFLWARKNTKYYNYPFPYFKRALQILAKRQGITVPDDGQVPG